MYSRCQYEYKTCLYGVDQVERFKHLHLDQNPYKAE